MTTVAARFVAHRDHNRPTVRDALDLALEDAELGWIDQIIGGIDRKKRDANFLKIRTGIIIV